MNDMVDIVLCRPEGPRACSACCGCFNLLDISRESVTAFLKQGSGRVRSTDSGISSERLPGTRDTTTHVCPYQGLDAAALPGCLLHPSITGADGRGASLYGERICEEFFCPAHYLLDEGAKRLLLAMASDWYRYSVAIIDPLGFVWMLDQVYAGDGFASRPERSSDAIADAVNAALEAHATFLNGVKGPIFHYSRSEYMLDYHRFSPASGSPETEAHRRSLREYLSGSVGRVQSSDDIHDLADPL